MNLLRIAFVVSLIGCWNFSDAEAEVSVFIYPAQGQSDNQMAKDRYACYQWAVGQTQFDPSQPFSTASHLIKVSPSFPPPDTLDVPKRVAMGTAGGAAVGAAVGAIAGNAGKGAAIGAVVGLATGVHHAAVAEARQKAVQREQSIFEAQTIRTQSLARERKQIDYQRAFSACLEAKGYTVK